MTHSPAQPRRRTHGGARRARALPAWALLVLLLLVAGTTRTAAAGPDDDGGRGGNGGNGPAAGAGNGAPADVDLFQELLAGQGDGEWRGTLNKIREKEDATWIGQVLGRLFRDRRTYGDAVGCAAFTAAYFADRAENGRVILGDAIVLRAHGDEAFLKAMRSHITKGEGGWDRLLDHARGLLAQGDVASQRAAVWFLSHEDGDQREQVRRELVARAREVLDGPDPTVTARLAPEYLDAFARLFGYRFATLEEAVTTLEGMKGLDLAELIRELSLRKDLPTAPDRQTLFDYGKRLVDAAVAAGSPEALEEFLDPKRTRSPRLRAYAVQKAAQMAPVPNALWGRMLRLQLAEETDPEAFRGSLGLIERIGFGNTPDEAARLAATIAQRLAARGPDAATGRDAVADRVRLAKLLGTLRVPPPELALLLSQGERLETDVLAQLVRSMGGMTGVPVRDVLQLYRLPSDDKERAKAVRIAVVDALGRQGFRGAGGDREAAAAALRQILTGEDADGLTRATDSEVRQHAIRSLGGHPGAETADVLRTLALGEDAVEAGVAVVVLRTAGATDSHAAAALGDVARAKDLAPERRVAALQSLAELAGAEEGPKTLAREAARDVLASEGPDEVRLEALAACATLADPLALEPAQAWWALSPDVDRTSAFKALLLAVVRADPAQDALVGKVLLQVGQGGAWDTAAMLSSEVLAAAPRPALQVVRARILLERGQLDGDEDQRREELAEAAALLRTMLQGEAGSAPPGAALLYVKVLRAAGAIAPDDAQRKALYLEALALTLPQESEEFARLGLDVADRLQQAPLSALLTEEEAQKLAEDRKTLQGRLGS